MQTLFLDEVYTGGGAAGEMLAEPANVIGIIVGVAVIVAVAVCLIIRNVNKKKTQNPAAQETKEAEKQD